MSPLDKFNVENYVKESLETALEIRIKEVLDYQINIDNFTLAIAEIDCNYGENEQMKAFRAQLSKLLEENQHQQARSQIMLDVIQNQLKV